MLQGIYNLFENLFQFLGMISQLVINMVKSIADLLILTNIGIPAFMQIIGQMPSFILTAALLGLTIAIINRLSVGVGGG